MPDDLFPIAVQPLTDPEIVEALNAAIRAGAAGNLSREGDLFLASIAAEVVADRLALAGVIMVRHSPHPR